MSTLCTYCVHREADTRDHVWPRGRRPPIGRWNTVPCCKRCNIEKADMSCEEWVVAQAKELRELDERPATDGFLYLGSQLGRAITYSVTERKDFLRRRLHRLADLRHAEPFVWNWSLPSEEEVIIDEWESGASF